jgi:hypothetical protein
MEKAKNFALELNDCLAQTIIEGKPCPGTCHVSLKILAWLELPHALVEGIQDLVNIIVVMGSR